VNAPARANGGIDGRPAAVQALHILHQRDDGGELLEQRGVLDDVCRWGCLTGLQACQFCSLTFRQQLSQAASTMEMGTSSSRESVFDLRDVSILMVVRVMLYRRFVEFYRVVNIVYRVTGARFTPSVYMFELPPWRTTVVSCSF